MSEIDISQVALEVMTPFVEVPTTTGIGTERFDSGNGTAWMVTAQISDAGNELRSKVIKSGRVTGKLTNASFRIYGYDINDPINVADIEAGINSSTNAITLPDSTQVAQSPRKQVNVKNAVLATIRVEGDCTGEDIMDRVDEVIYEQADQGVRR